MTPSQFRATHTDITTWSSADIESYEHLVEGTDPGIARAAASGMHIVGRHAVGAEVIVDYALRTELPGLPPRPLAA
ncbi:hypothetical protein ACH4FE_35800 [Streptomyces celluloflavus]|uniref:hypothetical protein n=1 Tax=Streptomyces celluloflavus TaxID=58344 RepID=UPI0037ADFA3E